MHNQFRAQLTGCNRVLYCLLEKQLQMLLTRGGHQASHTQPPFPNPSPRPTLAPSQASPPTRASLENHSLLGRETPKLLSAAPAQVAMTCRTSGWPSHNSLPAEAFIPLLFLFHIGGDRAASSGDANRGVAFRFVI